MNYRKTPSQIVGLVAAVIFLVACSLFTSARPTAQSTQPAVPGGWKVSTDSSGRCQVATPSDWQLGNDFFLAAQEPDPGPFVDQPGLYPPMGEALWEDTQLPEGKYFQIRVSLVGNEQVCSVWRVKAEVDFTEAEKSEVEQVGKTLQEVQR